MDGQTDVGHINLIGGLVTRNPPKNDCSGSSSHKKGRYHLTRNPATTFLSSLANQHGKTSVHMARTRKVGARVPVTPSDQSRVGCP